MFSVKKSWFCSLVALVVIGASAADPVAVWDGFTGESPLASGDYTWTKSDGTTVADGIVTIGADGGLALTPPAGSTMRTARKVTVILDVESIPSSDVTIYDLIVNGSHVSLDANNEKLYQHWNRGGSYGETAIDRASKHRLAITFEGTRGLGATTYIDGQLAMENTGLLSSANEVTALYLGNYNNANHFATGMKIAKLALFDTKLSATEVITYKFPSDQSAGSAVAKIGSATYETLAAAIAAAADGATIELVADVTEAEAIELTKDITLKVAEGAKNLLTPITGTGTITKAGAGTLTVFSLASGLTVSEGVIKAGANNPFGTAAHAVTVNAGGTIDFNGKGNATAVTYTIAGAGAGDHPYALMNSLAGTGTANLGNVTLAADATIGGAGNLSIAAPYDGGNLYTKGFTLTKRGTGVIHGGSLSYRDEDFGTGVIDIAEGTISINQWGCGFYNLKVIVRNGATLTHNNDRACTVRDLVVEAGGHVTGATASRYLLVSGTCESAGELSGISFANGATLKLTTISGVTIGRFIDTGTFTIDLSALTIPEGEATDIPALVAPAGTSFNLAKVSITGADGKWVAVEENGTLIARKVPALATVGDDSYTSVAEAFAAADGKTVKLLYSTTEAIVVDGHVTVDVAEGAVLGGAITGTGSITIPEGKTLVYTGTAAIAPTVKGAGTLVFQNYTGALGVVNGLTDAANWTGTFEFRNITCNNVGNNVMIQNFCNTNSTLRFNGYTQYLIYGTVNAKALEITDTLNLSGSYSAGPEFKFVVDSFSGNGAIINAVGSGSSAAAIKIVARENTYTGSITSTGAYRVAFLADAGAAIGGANGAIYIGAGATATVAPGATWTATNGITVEGELLDNGTLASAVSGAGAVVYTGALPSADLEAAAYTNELWTGSLVLKNYGTQAPNGNVLGAIPESATNTWGHAGSKVQFTNVKAYVPNNVTSYPWTLVLKDSGVEGEYAWLNNNGFSNSGQTKFGGLAGDGTFMGGGATHRLAFGDASAFTGNLTTNGKRVTLGSTDFLATVNDTLVITGTVTAAGQTWTANGGVTVKNGTTINYKSGPLTLASTAGVTIDPGTLTVGLADGATIPAEGAQVLPWSAKPTGVTFEKAASLPEKARVVAKADGLYLLLEQPFVISIQ